ncbi:hypothetical protein BGZ82_011686 [Podila clonocystis]|nr:hypothetical protein BGZ82_011686 [Podila clonocystis]
MSTTIDFTLHIPHIVENIADYHLFSDLVNCILVNRHWYSGFIPTLWENVITFRSVPTANVYTWRCHDYTRIEHDHQGFEKHAQHIQALTCQGPHSLKVLSDMN